MVIDLFGILYPALSEVEIPKRIIDPLSPVLFHRLRTVGMMADDKLYGVNIQKSVAETDIKGHGIEIPFKAPVKHYDHIGFRVLIRIIPYDFKDQPSVPRRAAGTGRSCIHRFLRIPSKIKNGGSPSAVLYLHGAQSRFYVPSGTGM